MEKFLDLPPELQNAILSQNKESLYQAQFLNKWTNELTNNQYYRQRCAEHPSKKELLTYVNMKNPRRFGFYIQHLTPEFESLLFYVFKNRVDISGSYPRVEQKLDQLEFNLQISDRSPGYREHNNRTVKYRDGTIVRVGNIKLLYNITEPLKESEFTLDYLSQYQIMKKRANCVKKLNNAKKLILDELDQTYSEFSSSQKRSDKFYLYALLVFNARVMEIETIETGLTAERAMADLPRLYREVRRYLIFL